MLFVMMRSNIRELPAFVDLAAEMGAVGVNAMHMIPFALCNVADQTAAADKQLCNEMLAEAQYRAHHHGLSLVAPKPSAIRLSRSQPRPEYRERIPIVLVEANAPGIVRTKLPSFDGQLSRAPAN